MGTEIAPLAYNGEIIHAKAEMLSLTDMWKAAGGDDARRPANWSRKEGASFVAHMRDVLNVPDGHIIRGTRGRNGETFAHWQIALAYAKYLSPDFHMWCNTVVRERMEGRAVGLPSDVIADIERTLGIMKMTIHKVTEIERAVERLESAKAAPTFDLSGTVTSDQMIEMAGVEKKDRVRGTSNMVTHAMLDFCNGFGCLRTPIDLNPARPWRFLREKAAEWLFGERLGAEMIRNQIGRVKARRNRAKGQGALKLVPPPQSEARP